MPLTISSLNFDGSKTTRSTNPATIKRLVNDLRRGDGDTIQIKDAAGVHYDVTDIGRGLELLANGTVDQTTAAKSEEAAAAKPTKPETKAMRQKALIQSLYKATAAANLEYRESMKAIKSIAVTDSPELDAARARWEDMKRLIKDARAAMKELRPLLKGNEAARLKIMATRQAAQEKRDEKIAAATMAFTIATNYLT
jgi:hypothetical protein